MRFSCQLPLYFFLVVISPAMTAAADKNVHYEKQIAPLFQKYCAGCHNDSDEEGHFSLETFASLQKGIRSKPALLPGDPSGSVLWRVLAPGGDLVMPPEGEKGPTDAERELIRRWIELGAKGPSGSEPDRLMLHVPQVASKTTISPVTALSFSPGGQLLAVGRYGRIELRQVGEGAVSSWPVVRTLTGLPGKVESLQFVRGGTQLLSGSGVTGSGGLAVVWLIEDGSRVQEFRGHRDGILDAEFSPDGTVLATCSYDKEIILWDVASKKELRRLSGHNGAVYDLAFNHDGSVLASASADATCKLWRTRDGERLDTLGQPLKEQYTIRFSPDGKNVIAAGADNRLRVWKLTFGDQPGINRMILARFAHEAPISTFCYSADGTRLVTAAEDGVIKFFDARSFAELQILKNQPDIISEFAADPISDRIVLGRLDGTLDVLHLPVTNQVVPETSREQIVPELKVVQGPLASIDEVEPNDLPKQAQKVTVPVTIRGAIHTTQQKLGNKSAPDVDCFRFSAAAGETWVIDVNAERSKSELDSYVEVLTENGEPIERVLLQAVRDSYFTFRGKDGKQTNDFRVFNWEEMTVNQLLYCNGEVVKLWQLPNGPDAGFRTYPGNGDRWNFFDTTGLSHALGEPCYIVEPHPPGTFLIPNGLPVFTIYYQNDDASFRESGKDSKLFFTAPSTGDYIVRIRDVRGTEGEKSTYAMSIRPPAPDYTVALTNRKLNVAAGNRVEVAFKVNRRDQFLGPITINADHLPPGISLSSPILVEEGQVDAFGVLSSDDSVVLPTEEQVKAIQLTASAIIQGEAVVHPVEGWAEIKISQEETPIVTIRAATGGVSAIPNNGDGPLEFIIHPGETIMLEVVVERNGFDGLIPFGGDESGRNLPHGIFVDNIGLNGLLLLEKQSVREFFITALDGVPEQSRLFHLRSTAKGTPASAPVLLHVKNRND